ncbi:hypothetical protein ACLKA6_005607 [Drosophila palustris]
MSPTGSKPKNINKSKPNSPPPAVSFRLPGIEEVAQSEAGIVPFILVDGMCSDRQSRQQFHLALSKCEKRRMKWIQRQCCVLPLLKYVKPAMRAGPTTQAEQEAQAELDFQEDLKQLCIAELTVGDVRESGGTITPIAHAASAENLLQNKPRLQEIRSQLEKLRRKQEETDQDFSPRAERGSIQALATKQPRLLRQGTFDVHRDDQLMKTSSRSSLGSSKIKSMGNSLAIKSTSLSQHRINNTPQPTNSTTCLFKNKSYSLLPDSKQNSRVQCSRAPRAKELPKIINQIGDLLLQLPLQQQEPSKLDPDESYTYLVTITPNTDAENSDGESITTSLTRNNSMATSSSPRNTLPLSSAANPAISIFSSATPRCSSSSISSDTNAPRNRTKTQPPPIQPKSSSFLKMSSRLLKKIKN